jgi:uncharacterized membrane protein YhhN
MPLSPNAVAVGPALVVAALAAAVDWFAVARMSRRLDLLAKPAVILALLAGVAVSPAAVAPASGALAGTGALPLGWLLVLIALAASVVGDLLLIPPARFVPGLVAFLVAQLAYLVRFIGEPVAVDDPARLGRIAVGVAIGLGVAWFAGRPILRGAARAGLAPAVAVYLVAIISMAVAATASGLWVTAIGAWLFVASDAMLGLARFTDAPQREIPIIAAYHLGQLLIVVGLLA